MGHGSEGGRNRGTVRDAGDADRSSFETKADLYQLALAIVVVENAAIMFRLLKLFP